MCDQAQAHQLQAQRVSHHIVSLQRHKRVDGLFPSWDILPDADTTIEKMLDGGERLRLKEGYGGYIHLKLIPGASFEYIEPKEVI